MFFFQNGGELHVVSEPCGVCYNSDTTHPNIGMARLSGHDFFLLANSGLETIGSGWAMVRDHMGIPVGSRSQASCHMTLTC